MPRERENPQRIHGRDIEAGRLIHAAPMKAEAMRDAHLVHSGHIEQGRLVFGG